MTEQNTRSIITRVFVPAHVRRLPGGARVTVPGHYKRPPPRR